MVFLNKARRHPLKTSFLVILRRILHKYHESCRGFQMASYCTSIPPRLEFVYTSYRYAADRKLLLFLSRNWPQGISAHFPHSFFHMVCCIFIDELLACLYASEVVRSENRLDSNVGPAQLSGSINLVLGTRQSDLLDEVSIQLLSVFVGG